MTRDDLGQVERKSSSGTSLSAIHWPLVLAKASFKVTGGRKHLGVYLWSSLQQFTLLTEEVHHGPPLKVSVLCFYYILSCSVSQVKPRRQILFVTSFLLSVTHIYLLIVAYTSMIKRRLIIDGQNSAVAPGQL